MWFIKGNIWQPGWHCRSSLTLDLRLCHIHHILLISHPLTTIFLSIWSLFYAKKLSISKEKYKTAFKGFLVLKPLEFYHHHHHHVVPLAQISLTLSRHFSLSFIASGRSSELHPISSHSCCMYVRADRPAFAWPYMGVHMSISLMSSSLLLQQCPACLVRLTWTVFVMGDRWPYIWCFVGCNILV